MASFRRPRGDDDDDDRRRRRSSSSRPQPQPQQQQQQQQQQQRRLHNLYVKDLPDFVDEACLVALFSRVGGAVVSACVLRGAWTRGGRSRGGKGKGGGGGRTGGGGRKGGGGDTSHTPQNKTTSSSSRSPDSSKRRGFVEMATAEGASAAIAALDGKFLALREEEEEKEEGGAGEGAVALSSPSLTLLVSDKPLYSSSSSSSSAPGAEGSRIEHCIRVAYALSKESREQGAAVAKAEAAAAPGGRRGARTKDLAAVNCCPERGLGLGEALERGPLGRRRGPRRSGRRRHRTQGSKRREREGERENAKKAFSLEAPLGSHSFSVSSSFFSFFRSPRISRLRSRASSSK